MYKRLTVTLSDAEVKALAHMAAAERRPPKLQVRWLVAKAAREAGLLENETVGCVSVEGTTANRHSEPIAA